MLLMPSCRYGEAENERLNKEENQLRQELERILARREAEREKERCLPFCFDGDAIDDDQDDGTETDDQVPWRAGFVDHAHLCVLHGDCIHAKACI